MNQSATLKDQQKVVMRGFAASVVVMSGLILGVYHGLDPLKGMEDLLQRLAFTLWCNVFAALMLLIGIIAVSNSRFFSEAINPITQREKGRIIVYGRYTDNTLQQLLLFSITTLTLSTVLDPAGMRIIPAITVTFMIGRISFFIGYLHNPLHRAFGMAMTLYPTAIGLFYAIYLVSSELLRTMS